MKILFSLLFTLTICFSSAAQITNQRIVDSNGTEQLLGQLTVDELQSPPFKKWFKKGYKKYNPDETALDRMTNLSDLDIEVFMGTWCGDSRREVPQLIKTLDAINFPKENLTIIGVNRTRDEYKKSPNNEEAGKNIHRVPTIIFYKDGKEVNRIVESALGPIESDMYMITSGKKYEPNYVVVDKLEWLIQYKGYEFIRSKADSIATDLEDLALMSNELNTYGYIQMYDEYYEKATAIFEVNKHLFPDESNVYDSLGEAYYEASYFEKSIENYLKVLEIEPDNENALIMIGKNVLNQQ